MGLSRRMFQLGLAGAAVRAITGGAGGSVLRAQQKGPQVTRHFDTIQIDNGFQVIDHFGASDCWSFQKIGAWSLASKNLVSDLLFSMDSGIGLSLWRFNIGGGINPQITNPWRTVETFEIAQGQYDWTRQANERWFLQAAKARGVPQFLAFVNSPPGRLTRNGLTFCSNTADTTNLQSGMEGQYATYLTDILEHFERNPDPTDQLTFQYISPVNEPQWDWTGNSQEGNRASNADIVRITQALAAELGPRKLTAQIALAESGSLPDMGALDGNASSRWGTPYGDYVDVFLNDPSMSGLLAGHIGYHSYWSDLLYGPLVSDRQALGAKMAQYPGWNLWQTEYCILQGSFGEGGNGRDLTMQTALEVARIIHLDMTVSGASAWNWWTAVSQADYKDGLIYTDGQQPGDPETIYPARTLWALGNYSRFVRPGMQRVELDGPLHSVTGVMGSAYKNAASRQVVAVYLNMTSQPQSVVMDFQTSAGWQLASITPYVTSDRALDQLRALPAVAQNQPFALPAQSVVTFVAQFG